MKPQTAETLQESSQILAATMYQARNIKSITWFSDWGGSGVLTQAMRHLSDQQVTLDKHCILMNHPTTRPGQAEALARRLKLDPISGGGKGNKLDELFGRLVILDKPFSAIQRMRKDDSYSGTQLALDGGKNALNAGNFATGAIGALGTAGIITATSPLIVAGGIAGAAYFVTSIAIKHYQGRRR